METGSLPSQILTEMSEEIVDNLSPLPNNSNLGDLNPNSNLGGLNSIVSRESSLSDNSESDESDDESEKNEITTILVGKRRRSQPAKYEPSPINSKRPPIKLRTPRSQPPKRTTSNNLTPVVRRKRGARCGNCPGCVRVDCSKCDYCKDKPKFGGPGKKKQRCKLRTCSNFQHKKAGIYHFKKVKPSPLIRPSPEAVLENIPPITKNKVATPTDSNNSSSTQNAESPSVNRDVGVAELVNAKPALSSKSYTNVTKQLATTAQNVKLETVKSPSPKPSTSSSAVSRTIPMLKSPTASVGSSSVKIQVEPATPLGVLKLDSAGAANAVSVTVTAASTAQTSTSVSAGKKDCAVLLAHATNKNQNMKAATPKVSSLLSSPKVVSPKCATKKFVECGDRKTCIQCGRGRTTNITRNSKFCNQRCIIKWMEANPNKMPKEAVGDSDKSFEGLEETTTSSPAPPSTNSPTPSSSKTLPRALKNLQIDMAKPGTKLNASDSSDSDSSSPAKNTTTTTTAASTNSVSRINSLASMITQTQKQMTNSKVPLIATPATVSTAARTPPEPAKTSTPAAKTSTPMAKTSTPMAKTSTPTAKSVAKRSATSQLSLSATKKAKITTKTSTQGTPKSVSFNLKPEENATSKKSSASIPSASMIPLTLDKIASFLQQPKKQYDGTKVKIPPGLSSDVRLWTVSHVVHYFKSTMDCLEYVDLFESQEVDGIALLLLTHETLVKCLGIKLGRALKIMNRVTELKLYHDHKINK